MRNRDKRNMQDDTGRKDRVIIAALILLILVLILAGVKIFLLKCYLETSEGMSHLKNHTNDQWIDQVDLESNCMPCPAGWKMSRCSCYYVSEEEITWEEARDECYKNNSVLVMIKDKAEWNRRRYWIGLLRDPEATNVWKWLDGTQATFTNWGVNQPDNYLNRENCGETKSGPWNDRHCPEKLFYICKK
ncbi:C-type lectin lectoxin-Phi1-like isoform X2 [Dendropsophus ebraccatus]|uniref:C-type lectin lectoxin-Phi1-like isoform X2 n=1 Tax=Dendropsophus ebraccatus TaxID=150705 RepID=UPI0038318381